MPYKDPEQQKAAQRKHYHDNKDSYTNRNRDKRSNIRKIIDDAKTNVPCADCKIIYPPYIMDFDHLPGHKKSFGISGGGSKGVAIETLLKEIAKCEIVCSNCHRQRTWDRLKNGRSRTRSAASLENLSYPQG